MHHLAPIPIGGEGAEGRVADGSGKRKAVSDDEEGYVKSFSETL